MAIFLFLDAPFITRLPHKILGTTLHRTNVLKLFPDAVTTPSLLLMASAASKTKLQGSALKPPSFSIKLEYWYFFFGENLLVLVSLGFQNIQRVILHYCLLQFTMSVHPSKGSCSHYLSTLEICYLRLFPDWELLTPDPQDFGSGSKDGPWLKIKLGRDILVILTVWQRTGIWLGFLAS